MMSGDKNHTHDETNGPDDRDGAGRGDDANGYGKHRQPDGPDEVNEPGDQYQPQEPLTFQKVWLMFKEAEKRFEETDRLLKEQSREADRRFKETDRILRRATQMAGGLGNNIGEVAEEYFFKALDKLPEVACVKIEYVGKLNKHLKGLQREYDVVLFGHDTLILVEVKHKLESRDVLAYYEKSLPVFRRLFPEYAGYKVIGAVAGMTATSAAKKLAFEKGLLVFTQSGQQARLHNPKGFEPEMF